MALLMFVKYFTIIGGRCVPCSLTHPFIDYVGFQIWL